MSQKDRPHPLLLRALRGESTPRRALWLHRQAGRFLPEYRALRERHSFEELLHHPELAAEVTLMPLRRFPLDAAIVFADLMSPVPALGLRFRFAPGPVVEAPVRDAAAVRALPDPDRIAPGEIARDVCATLRLVRSALDAQRAAAKGDAEGAAVPALLGFGAAPLTLAGYLVEGHGARDFPRLRALAHSDERSFSELLDKLSRLLARYLVEQHRSGAEAVQVFDTWAGLFSLADWQRLVRPHLESLLAELEREGVPSILFLNDAPHLLEQVARLPGEALALDWRIDLAQARSRFPEKVLQGNLDPAALLSGPAATRRAARDLLGRMPPRGHVVNLGHGIHPDTSLESVAALIEEVHVEEVHVEEVNAAAPQGLAESQGPAPPAQRRSTPEGTPRIDPAWTAR